MRKGIGKCSVILGVTMTIGCIVLGFLLPSVTFAKSQERKIGFRGVYASEEKKIGYSANLIEALFCASEHRLELAYDYEMAELDFEGAMMAACEFLEDMELDEWDLFGNADLYQPISAQTENCYLMVAANSTYGSISSVIWRVNFTMGNTIGGFVLVDDTSKKVVQFEVYPILKAKDIELFKQAIKSSGLPTELPEEKKTAVESQEIAICYEYTEEMKEKIERYYRECFIPYLEEYYEGVAIDLFDIDNSIYYLNMRDDNEREIDVRTEVSPYTVLFNEASGVYYD